MLKLLVLTIFLIEVRSYKILCVFPSPAPSHNILGHGYVKHLLEAGHQVTYITSQFYSKPHSNLRQIDVTSHYGINVDDFTNIRTILESKSITMDSANGVLKFMFKIHNATLFHENVQTLINKENEEFDLVIAEICYGETYSGFAAVFNCPYIWSATMDPHWGILRLMDEVTNPAYTNDIASANVPPLSFLQRIEELWAQIEMVVIEKFYVSRDNEAYTKAFGAAVAKRGRVLPPLDIQRYNASLMLGNSNKPLSPAIRLPPSYKEIGGYHIDAHVTPLPEKINKILNETKNGVIYFSLGSNVKSKDMPEEMKMDLLKMFGELKYDVLWKLEEKLGGLPKNVHIVHWAPQPSILAHPNCILFVSHGGLLSITETINYGVPIVGIPVFADQFLNVNKAVGKGFAKKVDLSVDMAGQLKKAIHDIISDKSYRAKAKELSTIFHDRLISPGAELVHWIEHVIRTKGAPHLRSVALMVPWYQKLFLDLIVVILAVVFIIVKVLKKVFCSRTGKKIKIN